MAAALAAVSCSALCFVPYKPEWLAVSCSALCLVPRKPEWLVIALRAFLVMSFVNGLVVELKDIAKFLAARSGSSGDDLGKSMVASFSQKILALKAMSTAEALDLTKALNESGLPPPLAKTVQETIDSRLATHASEFRGLDKFRPQHLKASMTNYFTEAEWTVLRDGAASIPTKLQTVLSRLQKVGLRYPSEQTTRFAVAIVLLASGQGSQWPRASAVFGMVQDFKSLANSTRPLWTGPHIVDYGSDPKDLPPKIYQQAYGDGSGLVRAELENLTYTAEQCVPLRPTSILLKRERDANQGGNSGGSGSSNDPAAMMMQCLQRMMTMQALPGSQGPPGIGLTIYGQGQNPMPGQPSGSGSGSAPPLALPPVPVQPSGSQVFPSPEKKESQTPVQDTKNHTSPMLALKPTLRPVGQPAPAVAAEEGEAHEGTEEEEAEDKPAEVEESRHKKAPRVSTQAYEEAALQALFARDNRKKVMKKPSAAKAVLKRPAKAAIVKRPSAHQVELLLGCGKCRGSPNGCLKCRDPSFGGRRFTRT